jgi:hypothetical protein
MGSELESKQLLTCMTGGRVVLRVHVPTKMMMKKSISGGKHQLKATLRCRCNGTNTIRSSNTFNNRGVVMSINRRMVETWYVYTALKRLVDGSIDVFENYDKAVINLVNRDEFNHTNTDNYELTTINIHPDTPEEAFAGDVPAPGH